MIISALPAFLEFLHQEDTAFSVQTAAGPSAARWTQTALPRDLDPDPVTVLLAGCDRDTGVGVRDYAIMLLLFRMGLRAAEVVGLELADLQWGAGDFLVHGMGNHLSRFPLPV